MNKFPRTNVGGLSVSRMIIGTNWFAGYSHTTKAKDEFINEHIGNYKKVADIIEVFLKNGIDTILGSIQLPCVRDGIQEAQQRTGIKAIIIGTPGFPIGPDTPVKGFLNAESEKILDEQVKLGANICMPHEGLTDAMVDRCTRTIRKVDEICKMIRERGMIPGLSTHMPQAIVYADESGLDVETYISLYNSMGFLMMAEVDWIAQIIRKARKPVLTIKPMAAGQLRPLQALTFVWNSIRDQDMVALGTMSPREAEECIDLSLNILEHRNTTIELQETRSKSSIKSR